MAGRPYNTHGVYPFMPIVFYPPHPSAAPGAAPNLPVTLPPDRVLVIDDLCDTLEGIPVLVDADQRVEVNLLAGGIR